MSEENYETYCEFICIEERIHSILEQIVYIEGQSYWFHEDRPVSPNWFLPVVDEQGFPVTKRVRIN